MQTSHAYHRFILFISVTSCPLYDHHFSRDWLDAEGKSCVICYDALPQVVILKMYKEVKITVEGRIQIQKAWGPLSVPKSHSHFLPNASEPLCYQKRPVSVANWDPHSSAPLAFIFHKVRSVAKHWRLHSHPNGYRVPKLTLENSKGMSLPICQQAVRDSKHSCT